MQTVDFEDFLSRLTIQEKKVLAFIIDGLTSKQIGTVLFCSESTIKKHREHILQKANIKGVVAIRRFLTAIKPHLP